MHAPHTPSDYTLISSRHGWRVRRYPHHEDFVSEWWCPGCWAELKQIVDGPISSMHGPLALKGESGEVPIPSRVHASDESSPPDPGQSERPRREREGR